MQSGSPTLRNRKEDQKIYIYFEATLENSN